MTLKLFPDRGAIPLFKNTGYIAGLLAVVVSGALWGSGGPAVRISYIHGILPLTLALYRATLASVIIALYGLWKSRKDIFLLNRKEILPCLISGLFGVAICNTSAAFAMGRIPVGLTFVLINTAPFWVMILGGIVWKERVTGIEILALFTAIWGVWVAVGGVARQPYNLLGVAAALGAGLGYAVYILNGKHGMGRNSPLKAYTQMFFWGTLSLWVAVLLSGQAKSLFTGDWKAWMAVLYITIFSDLGGYAMLMVALRMIPGGVAAIVSMTEIPFSMLWSWLFLSEIPSFRTVRGGMLIITAVILLSIDNTEVGRKVKGLIRSTK